MLQRVKEVQESDLRMVGALARNIQRVLPVSQADIDAAAALGKGWVVWKVIEVTDPIDNLRGGTQLVIKQNSITPGQNVRRVLIVSGPGGETVVIGPGPSPLLLPSAVANSLSYVKAFGGTSQASTPTPDTPMDIVSNNGVLKYGQYGKNLFDKSLYDGHGWYNSGGVIADAPGPNATVVMRLTPNKTYYFKHCSVTGGVRVMYTTEENWGVGSSCDWILSNPTTTRPNVVSSFTVPSDAKWVFLLAGRSESEITATFQEQLNDYILSEDELTADTPYEPYHFGIHADGTVETIKDSLNNTATAEMLLKVGDYQDVQSIIDGTVTRNVKAIVLTGTETWIPYSTYSNVYIARIAVGKPSGGIAPICNYFAGYSTYISMTANDYGILGSSAATLAIKNKDCVDVTAFTTWLADQYAAGTPVIVIYPLATPTTESVAGQTLQVQAGDNTLEITQASLTGLELEAKYTKAV